MRETVVGGEEVRGGEVEDGWGFSTGGRWEV